VRLRTQSHHSILSHHRNPFKCFAFVCDSQQSARRLTYSLAKAFQEFSKSLAGAEDGAEGGANKKRPAPKRFAIDLRTPEQIEDDLKRGGDVEDDSEV